MTAHHLLTGDTGKVVGHETIDLITDRALAPHPQNYELWLAYRLNTHPELRKTIDAHLASGEPMTEDVVENWYDRFISNTRLSGQMLMAGERIARELNGVLTTLHATGEQTNAYGESLTQASDALSRGVDESSLRAMIGRLSEATQQMAAKNKELSARLETSTGEINQMREALRQVRAEALTDSLTGLANRKLFDETLRARMKESNSERTPMCLVLCDIDFFKRFNDTWGHHTGDQIIRFVAATLQRNAKGDHLAARYGGEEFAMVLPRTDLRTARTLSEAIRKAVESKTLVRKSTGEDLGHITISVGIALCRPDDTPTSLIERADACLYASKRGLSASLTVG
jgi:diguanylate cyclase